MAQTYPIASPEWWRDRLWKKLQDRQDDLTRFDNYYSGDHPLPWLPEGARDEFRRLLKMSRSNYMGLVVDATAERMVVQGFRFGGTEADEEAWRIWQANNMDADSDLVIHEAVKLGCSYVLVAPNPDDEATPLITGEHPSQAIVDYVPGSRRRRAAGLKAWRDDWTGDIMATLLLPDAVYKWQAPDKTGLGDKRWTVREVAGEPWPAPNPLGVVSLVEVPNRPRMLGGGVSEIDDLTDAQDRINKTIADRLLNQDFGAFPQKWGTGIDLDQRFELGRQRMFQAEQPDARFGQFDSSPLVPLSEAKREDVKDIASRARVPSQYLLGDIVNVAGEALKAAESGLVAKIKQRMRPPGESFEEVQRLSFAIKGDRVKANAIDAQTIWANPEFRTEGELVDALTKMATLGVPQEALWERWGATPQEIARWRGMRSAEAFTSGVALGAFPDAGVAAPEVEPPT
jgi:hypothetical protein